MLKINSNFTYCKSNDLKAHKSVVDQINIQTVKANILSNYTFITFDSIFKGLIQQAWNITDNNDVAVDQIITLESPIIQRIIQASFHNIASIVTYLQQYSLPKVSQNIFISREQMAGINL